ncbi:DNA-directed RNA polymerase subunit K [Candidatus Pacearchaeota archaeon]|jgi:DNA-directed RNA polymerase subunit K/omega|nr:DNA-directed RNA polymerase subunit K [Candidatus Pacearchaeota archaeon]
MLKGFSKYETARILGARALQISMNAPLLIKINKEDLEKINYDAIKIAEVELNSEILPISIYRPFPEKRDEKLKRVRGQQISEKGIQEKEAQEESEIVEGGEIMELANPDDEVAEEEAGEGESE